VEYQSLSHSSLRPLVTFLNHGVLPFVGRRADIEHIVQFWSEGVSEPTLRALLVTAEAGMGKSRLVSELLPRIEQQGGAVVHVRFYPDAALAVAPLVARAVWLSKAGTELLHGEPETSVGGTIASLRRVSHLRPMLLVLEDVHLLNGEPLRELQRMLQALSDQGIAMLLLARPDELTSRGLFEPYFVEEFQLQGFNQQEIEELLSDLFGGTLSDWLASMLHTATLGNPLAIRSVLRSLVNSGAIVQEHSPDRWRLVSSRETLERSIGQSVDILTEGMITHLQPDERAAAEQLASLGEVVAMETAREAIPDADRLIELLLFRGILFQLSLPVTPVLGTPGSARLLAFSHTLLHRRFAERSALDTERLLRIIEKRLPLYSITPVHFLAHSPLDGEQPEQFRGVIDSLQESTTLLLNTSDWQLVLQLLDAAEHILAALTPCLDEEARLAIQLPLLIRRIRTVVRNGLTRECLDLIERLGALTVGPLPEQLLQHRITALRFRFTVKHIQTGKKSFDEWEEIEQLVESHPQLRFTEAYPQLLREMGHVALLHSDFTWARMVERRVSDILESPEATEKFRQNVRSDVLPSYTLLFETPEELAYRNRLLDEFSRSGKVAAVSIARRKLQLLRITGHVDQVTAMVHLWLPRFNDLGWVEANELQLYLLCDRAGLGGNLRQIHDEVIQLCDSSRAGYVARNREVGIHFLLVNTLLCGDYEFAQEVMAQHPTESAAAESETRLLIALADEDYQQVLSILDERKELSPTELFLRDIVGRNSPEHPFDSAHLRSLLTRPILRILDLLTFHALLLAVTSRSKHTADALDSETRSAIRHALDNALTWLAERRLHAYMLPFLQRYQQWFTKRGFEEWRARMNAIEQEHRRDLEQSSADRRLHVTMIGTISVQSPSTEAVPVRGARLRTLLGLLVADRMLATPLTHREFCRIASGDNDPEHARKTTNAAVMRLRDILGDEAILTDEETPRLHPALVHVDLLDALDACRAASASLHNRQLMHAWPAIRTALDIWNGAVPFPALYDNFFEAARNDFEVELRTTAIRISRTLLAENDPATAEQLLRRALAVIPEDEEIAELLEDSLTRTGRRLEVERLKVKGEADATIE
jgi:hypothetical protein